MNQVDEVRKQSLNDRFTITQKLGYKEYQKGLQAKSIATNPSVADYKIGDQPFGKRIEYSVP